LIDYIKYRQEYESAVIDLWNKTLINDQIDVLKFRKQALFDVNFQEDLCVIAIDDKKVVGFILGIKRIFPYLERGLEPDKGYISVMFVDKAYQRKGIGTKLLKIIEDKLIVLGSKKIILGAYSPNYFFGGVDIEYQGAINFFNKNGYFGNEEHYSMYRSLHDFNISDKIKAKEKDLLINEGIRVINFDYAYALELLEFARCNFGAGWKRNCLMAMQENKAQDYILLVLNQENKIIGFSTRAIDGNPLRFGPIGVSNDYRNKGLGSILLLEAMYNMKKRGIYHMFFVSTEKNGRRFYERHGIKVFKTFNDYQKEVAV